MSDAPIIRRLMEPGAARGLITFIITASTLALAFMLVWQAFYADSDALDERFKRGREIFTAFTGILGTIVGFYFGQEDQGPVHLNIAAIKIDTATAQLRTHVSGGTPPYKYSITHDQNAFAPIKDQLTDDGWILHKLQNIPTKGRIILDVADSRGRKESKDLKLTLDEQHTPAKSNAPANVAPAEPKPPAAAAPATPAERKPR
jgi:hypothetical protein